MMHQVVIVDYQLGNIHSVSRACMRVGLQPFVSSDPAVVRDARGLILPGVGAFGDAMSSLRSLKLDQAIQNFAESGRPFMGICLGMQLLFESSEEFGLHDGLGVVPGTVRRVPSDNGHGAHVKVPHVGWNAVWPNAESDWARSALRNVDSGESMYFVHSYYVDPAIPQDVLSWTRYGNLTFCSSIQKANIFASQFHPEKSGPSGLSIYTQWAAQVAEGCQS